jgi:hypothetical protein
MSFQQECERNMRKIALLGGSLICLLLSSGCATPGYSAAERNQMIGRNMNYEGLQAIDDADALLLLRPAGHMTIWPVQ